jgi:hypothetical protein
MQYFPIKDIAYFPLNFDPTLINNRLSTRKGAVYRQDNDCLILAKSLSRIQGPADFNQIPITEPKDLLCFQQLLITQSDKVLELLCCEQPRDPLPLIDACVLVAIWLPSFVNPNRQILIVNLFSSNSLSLAERLLTISASFCRF